MEQYATEILFLKGGCEKVHVMRVELIYFKRVIVCHYYRNKMTTEMLRKQTRTNTEFVLNMNTSVISVNFGVQ